jgi:hypothetical protein
MPRGRRARSVALNQGWDYVVSLAESSEAAVSFAKDVVDHISTQAALTLKTIPTDDRYLSSDECDRRSILDGLSRRDSMLCDTMQHLFTQYHSAVLDPSILKLQPLLRQVKSLTEDLIRARSLMPAGKINPNERPDMFDAYTTAIKELISEFGCGCPQSVVNASRRILGLKSANPLEREALLSVLSITAAPKDGRGYEEWFEAVQTRFARRMESVGSSQEGVKGGSIVGSQALKRVSSSSEANDVMGRKKPRTIQTRARGDPGVASNSSCSTGESV